MPLETIQKVTAQNARRAALFRLGAAHNQQSSPVGFDGRRRDGRRQRRRLIAKRQSVAPRQQRFEALTKRAGAVRLTPDAG